MRQNTALLMDAVANDADKQSGVLDIRQVYALSFVATFTDAASTGTLKVQVSNDIPVDTVAPPQFVPTNWADAPSASVSVTAGGTLALQLNPLDFAWARITWTRTAGAGTFSVRTNTQGF